MSETEVVSNIVQSVSIRGTFKEVCFGNALILDTDDFEYDEAAGAKQRGIGRQCAKQRHI